MEPFKFIHAADIHLGYKQYNLEERFKDFNRAFKSVLDLAIKHNVDFLLISGDLFNTTEITPECMSAAYKMLSNFKEQAHTQLKREIPVIVIEGNHDMHGYASSRSWLDFLGELQLIWPIQGSYNDEKETFSFPLYNTTAHLGGKIHIKDAMIYGFGYAGSITEDYLKILPKGLDSQETFNILMMHFGIAGEIKDEQGVDFDDRLNPLHQVVDYLALGHFHKKYVKPSEKPWIFNPGSTEINDFTETNLERGVFLVDVKSKQDFSFKFIPCILYTPNIEEDEYIPNRNHIFYNPLDRPSVVLSSWEITEVQIMHALGALLPAKVPLKNVPSTPRNNLAIPIVTLFLKGEITYPHTEINLSNLKKKILDKFDLLDLRIINKTDSFLEGLTIETENNLPVAEIEQKVLTSLIRNQPELSTHTDLITKFMINLKTPLMDTKTDWKSMENDIKTWYKSNLKQKQETIDSVKILTKKKKMVEKPPVSQEFDPNSEDIYDDEEEA